MEHKIVFRPAWDRTDPNPHKNYGVSDIDIKFLVIGNKGTVEFDLSTNWYLPHMMEKRIQILKNNVISNQPDFLIKYWISPYPLDVCYYSLEKMSEDDTWFDEGVSWAFDHKPCFYGYRYEREENDLWTTDFVYDLLLKQGEGAVFEYLESYYIDTFGKE